MKGCAFAFQQIATYAVLEGSYLVLLMLGCGVGPQNVDYEWRTLLRKEFSGEVPVPVELQMFKDYFCRYSFPYTSTPQPPIVKMEVVSEDSQSSSPSGVMPLAALHPVPSTNAIRKKLRPSKDFVASYNLLAPKILPHGVGALGEGIAMYVNVPICLVNFKAGQYITWFTPAAALKKTDLQSFYESGFGKQFLPKFVDTDNDAMWLLSTLTAGLEEGVAMFAVESSHPNSQLVHATLEGSKLIYLRATKDIACLGFQLGLLIYPFFCLMMHRALLLQKKGRC